MAKKKDGGERRHLIICPIYKAARLAGLSAGADPALAEVLSRPHDTKETILISCDGQDCVWFQTPQCWSWVE